MPITSSAKKAMRQAEAREKRNLVYKNKMRSLKKSAVKAVQNKKQDEASQLVSDYFQAVDKAAKINILHDNKAARLKKDVYSLFKEAFGKDSKLPDKSSKKKTQKQT